ncbi:uncharacterized protein LOC129587176 [Paramacrobiotus metropolitanus]|uniref:uncharacterized protein LOC129587176 n=1 Tax=Paramacrobiotus metropolitanus TaxID=2943436 RepID=UPI0024465BF5|nr:uncharacterized protein LOC129587176 [Paramacrobiotus metropolitanus]
MTPVCWDINVTMHVQGKHLVVIATEDIPTYTGLHDLRTNENGKPPSRKDMYTMTRDERRDLFQLQHQFPCECGKCTTNYEAEINPLKCTTVGCSERLPSDNRALEPCPQCGALNSERLELYRSFATRYEKIRTAEAPNVTRLSLELDIDDADILHPDAHLRYVCGWDRARQYADDDRRLEEGWRMMQDFSVCIRNIYPKYSVARVFHLEKIAEATGKVFKDAVDRSRARSEEPDQRLRLEPAVVDILAKLHGYTEEIAHILGKIAPDSSLTQYAAERCLQTEEWLHVQRERNSEIDSKGQSKLDEYGKDISACCNVGETD